MELDPAMVRRLAARKSQMLGNNFEMVTRNRLRALGVRCVEKVATPMRKTINGWKHAKKVSCDVKGVLPPNGRAVHVESKWRGGENLVWSDLDDHQHERLQECMEAGGISLIAYSDGLRGFQLLSYAHLINVCRWAPRRHLSDHDLITAGNAGLYHLGVTDPARLSLREVPHH